MDNLYNMNLATATLLLLLCLSNGSMFYIVRCYTVEIAKYQNDVQRYKETTHDSLDAVNQLLAQNRRMSLNCFPQQWAELL